MSPLPAARGNVSVLGQNHHDSIQSLPLAMQWRFFFLEYVASGAGKTCKGPGFYGGAAVAPVQQLDLGQSEEPGPISSPSPMAAPHGRVWSYLFHGP